MYKESWGLWDYSKQSGNHEIASLQEERDNREESMVKK